MNYPNETRVSLLSTAAAVLAIAILADEDRDRPRPTTTSTIPTLRPPPSVPGCTAADVASILSAIANKQAAPAPVYRACQSRNDGSMRCHSRTRLLPVN